MQNSHANHCFGFLPVVDRASAEHSSEQYFCRLPDTAPLQCSQRNKASLAACSRLFLRVSLARFALNLNAGRHASHAFAFDFEPKAMPQSTHQYTAHRGHDPVRHLLHSFVRLCKLAPHAHVPMCSGFRASSRHSSLQKPQPTPCQYFFSHRLQALIGLCASPHGSHSGLPLFFLAKCCHLRAMTGSVHSAQ